MTPMHCPRCGHTKIHGTRRAFTPSRTIEEFYCPNCELLEIADSEQPNYVEILDRWRDPPAAQP